MSLIEDWAEKFLDLNNTLGGLHTGIFHEYLGNLTTSGIVLALLAMYTTSRIVTFFRDLKVR
jgi:hypothetical protein